ncbi:MAG: helix-turn-helix domain-containing protein, partial [Chitinophagaceae bacterium]
ELRGMKQEALAIELGISQQAVSKLEQSEQIEDSTLDKVATVLGVSKEAIKNYSDEVVFNVISNTYHNSSSDHSTLIASSVNYQPTFNTVEKIVELKCLVTPGIHHHFFPVIIFRVHVNHYHITQTIIIDVYYILSH